MKRTLAQKLELLQTHLHETWAINRLGVGVWSLTCDADVITVGDKAHCVKRLDQIIHEEGLSYFQD